MNAQAYIDQRVRFPSYRGQGARVERVRPRQADYAAPGQPLHPALQERLDALGVKSLYSHQAEALDLARSGANVMVATPSASGKTLCYNLPVAESLLAARTNRGLYLFPTKALAQDQRRTLVGLLGKGMARDEDCVVFDGDTPQQSRAEIKKRARVVFPYPAIRHP